MVFIFSRFYTVFSRLCSQSSDRFGVTTIYLRQRRHRLRLGNLGDQVEIRTELCTSLDFLR